MSPNVMMGKPVIHGTRITVELILHKFAGGATEGDLLEDYPHLATNDIRGRDRGYGMPDNEWRGVAASKALDLLQHCYKIGSL